jgi:hypothetical protein
MDKFNWLYTMTYKMIFLSLAFHKIKLLYNGWRINKNNYFYKIRRRAEYFVFINNLLFIRSFYPIKCILSFVWSHQEFSAVNAQRLANFIEEEEAGTT